MTEKVEYIGKDLEAMSFAVNYHKWILDEFRPFLGKRLVEVGAGTGSFSELLLRESIDSLTVIEPSEMFSFLKQNVSQTNKAEIKLFQNIFANVCEQIATEQKPDSILYINVLEHIEDDLFELVKIHQTLVDGGKCFIFVPALMSLYGEFDRKIGHFRRYNKTELEEKCSKAGFKILKSTYFDLSGIIPWWIKYKLFKSDSLESGAVTLYDKIAIPVISKFEKVIPAPIGKNILLVAEKSKT